MVDGIMYFRNEFYGSHPGLIYVIHSIISKDPILISYIISLYLSWVSVSYSRTVRISIQCVMSDTVKVFLRLAGYPNLFDLLRFDVDN